MYRTRRDQASDARPPFRLRIPAALAVVVLGGSASVAMTFTGCDVEPVPPEPTDAGERLSKELDDADIDNDDLDGAVDESAPRDAYVPPDTPLG